MLVYSAEDLGKLIRSERKHQGYTQGQLADYSGVGITFVSNLERGKASSEVGKVIDVLLTLGIDLDATPRRLRRRENA